MRRALLAVLLAAAAASPARAWRLFGEPSDGKIRPVQRLADEHKPREVLAALTPAFVQGLRGTDLRQAYVLMGDSLRQLGRSDEAVGQYQLGVALFPKNVDLLVRLGALLHAEGLDDEARPLFVRAIAAEPKHWNAHQGLAEIDRKSGFLDRAAEHYEIALESVGDRAEIWRDYAEVLLARRDFKTADLAIRRALALDPRSADARLLLGLARRAQEDLDGAADEFDAALALGAGIGARRAKALTRLEGGRLDEAAAEAAAVLREVPGDGAALWVLARVKLARGDRAGALRALADARPDDAGDGFSVAADRTLAAQVRAAPEETGGRRK